MLKLPVEETTRLNADMKVSVGTTRTPAGRRKETFGRTNENQNFALHSLPQQLALRTPQRRIQDDPKSQNIGVPVMMHRTVNGTTTKYRTGGNTRVMMLAPKLRHEQRTEIPELKTKCKTAKRSSSVEGTCSQSGCGPDFSSSRFGKVDYVLVNMRLARTHIGPRRTRNNLLRLDIVDFQAFDWSSYQKTSGETADTFVDSKTSRCSRWFAEDAGRSPATTRGGHCNR